MQKLEQSMGSLLTYEQTSAPVDKQIKVAERLPEGPECVDKNVVISDSLPPMSKKNVTSKEKNNYEGETEIEILRHKVHKLIRSQT